MPKTKIRIDKARWGTVDTQWSVDGVWCAPQTVVNYESLTSFSQLDIEVCGLHLALPTTFSFSTRDINGLVHSITGSFTAGVGLTWMVDNVVRIPAGMRGLGYLPIEFFGEFIAAGPCPHGNGGHEVVIT